MTTNVSEQLFKKAADIVGDKNITPARKASVDEKCQLYGLYKRGTVGKLTGPYTDEDSELKKRPKDRPAVYNMEARAKHDAWADADKYTMQEARDEYVKLALHLVGEPIMDAIEEEANGSSSKSVNTQTDCTDVEKSENTLDTTASVAGSVEPETEPVELTEPNFFMRGVLYVYACWVAVLLYLFACAVELVATFVAALLSHEAVKATAASVIVAGMNAFLRQPDLAEHLQVMNKTLDAERDEAVKQMGRDTPAVVEGFLAGVWDGLNKKTGEQDSGLSKVHEAPIAEQSAERTQQ